MKIQRTWWGEQFVKSLLVFMGQSHMNQGKAYCSEHRILSCQTRWQ